MVFVYITWISEMFIYLHVSYTREAETSPISINYCLSVWLSVTLENVILLTIHRKTGESNSKKVCTKLGSYTQHRPTAVLIFLTALRWRSYKWCVCLLITRKGTNLMKLCTKVVDIPRGNIGPFPFRFLHHFKMVAFCMWYNSLP